ncbi:Der1-like family-domain-containing protein [Suillus paluster]|uniref:Der1-like family-domain-containing protein n=1 Tax=Suillus paluster TaxID=48578 RepID=UPI001B885B9B|nr:Der1-like family-domain-containing protein [Suillus paluster]KAG1741432.1 Der1-like family-domain-containing protein [Suillus paluster]
MADILAELRKIPPVTRFLVSSSLGVTLSAIMNLVSPYRLIFISQAVISKWEVWRLYTSLFLGSMNLNYIFEMVMLYRNSNTLESTHYERRSSDYAWQLFLASLALIGINRPLQSYSHSRALFHTLTYLMCSLSPPGALTSVMGLITIPVAYFPYALLGMDLLMGGKTAAAQGVSGMLVGHAWWWLIWGSGIGTGGVEQGIYAGWGRAPAWLKSWFGEREEHGRAGSRRGGVQAFAPRQRAEEAAASGRVTGHSWGSGTRLGDS